MIPLPSILFRSILGADEGLAYESCKSPVHTMSKWDIGKTLMEGGQPERTEKLAFYNVCKCQCMAGTAMNPGSSEGSGSVFSGITLYFD